MVQGTNITAHVIAKPGTVDILVDILSNHGISLRKSYSGNTISIRGREEDFINKLGLFHRKLENY